MTGVRIKDIWLQTSETTRKEDCLFSIELEEPIEGLGWFRIGVWKGKPWFRLYKEGHPIIPPSSDSPFWKNLTVRELVSGKLDRETVPLSAYDKAKRQLEKMKEEEPDQEESKSISRKRPKKRSGPKRMNTKTEDTLLTCPEHKTYQGKRRPRSGCSECEKIWRSKHPGEEL